MFISPASELTNVDHWSQRGQTEKLRLGECRSMPLPENCPRVWALPMTGTGREGCIYGMSFTVWVITASARLQPERSRTVSAFFADSFYQHGFPTCGLMIWKACDTGSSADLREAASSE